MPILRFLEWTPDVADFGGPGSISATNALPGRISYKPMPSLSVISDPLPGRPLGAIESEDINLVSYQYVGTARGLYELGGNLGWTSLALDGASALDSATTSYNILAGVIDSSGGTYLPVDTALDSGLTSYAVFNFYDTSAGEVWEFAQWENKVLAVNWDNNPQQITMGGAEFSDLTTALKARHIAAVGDFVVMGNTFDSTDGNRPNRIRWSAQGDEEDYAVSPSTQSDFRDLTTGGAVQKILGGEVGIIISRTATFRMTYEGAGVVFRIDEVQPDIGAIAPGSCCRLGENVYYLSDQGFIELTGNGTGIRYIGDGRVDNFMLEDIDHNYLGRMSCIADPTGNRIAWAYPGAGHTGGRPNKIIIYDRTFDKWCLIAEECELILRSKGIDFTLDELPSLGYTDLDAMTVSLDSNQWQAKSMQFSAFDENFKLGFFRGLSKTATLLTQEVQLHEGYITALNAFSPLVDGGVVTARVGSRDRQSDSVSYTASLSQSASGRFTKRVNARFHRFELTITGSEWTDAVGVDVAREDAPKSGRRG